MLETVGIHNPGLYYMLLGTSKNGTGHTVICLNSKIVHDPSIDQSGIVGPMTGVKEYADGVWFVEFIGAGIARAPEFELAS